MKNVIILCYANYCRSPVAESIFKNFDLNEISFCSRGLIQFNKFHMDPRSQKFLESEQIPFKNHLPKKIKDNDIMTSDLIIAMDYDVMFEFVKKFPKAKSKVKTINFFNPSLNVIDPYKFNKIEEYYEQLINLKLLCEKWKTKLKEI